MPLKLCLEATYLGTTTPTICQIRVAVGLLCIGLLSYNTAVTEYHTSICQGRTMNIGYEWWGLLVSSLQLGVSVLGFLIVGYTLWYANQSIQSNVFTNMAAWTFELDKVFLEHPHLRPYFCSGKPLDSDPKDDDYYRVLTIAELTLDMIDSMLQLEGHFPRDLPLTGWKEWMRDCFRDSPVTCQVFEERRKWFVRVQPLYDKLLSDKEIPVSPGACGVGKEV